MSNSHSWRHELIGVERKSRSFHYEMRFRAKKERTTISTQWDELRMTIFKTWKYQGTGEYVEQVKQPHLARGNAEWRSHYENCLAPPKRLNTELPYDPAIPFLGFYPRQMKIYVHTKICLLMFTAPWNSQWPQTGNTSNCGSWMAWTRDWLKPAAFAHNGMQVSSENEPLIHEWISGRDARGGSPSQKATRRRIPLMWRSGKGKTIWLAEAMFSEKVSPQRESRRKFGRWWNYCGFWLRRHLLGSIRVLKFLELSTNPSILLCKFKNV